MSYCRWSEGDVYMYGHVGGYFECCCCRFAEKEDTVFTKGIKKGEHPLFNEGLPACTTCSGIGCDNCRMHGHYKMKTRSEAIAHLEKHIKAGDVVPYRAIETLKRELKEEGETIAPMFDDGYDGPVLIDTKTGKVTKLGDEK